MGCRRVDGTIRTRWSKPEDKLQYKKGTSRQYQDQLRYKSLGLCIKCQKPQAEYSKNYCANHVKYQRELQRNKIGRVRRNLNCKSYKKGE
jgi:hypothetical protein